MKALLMALAMITLGFGCAKESKDRTNTNVNTLTAYQLTNGSCYSTSSGQQVDNSYCFSNTGTNNGYHLSNGLCYSTSSNQQVAINYCSNTGSNPGTNTGYQLYNGACYSTSNHQQVPSNYCSNTGSSTGQACYGMYSYNGQQGQCYGSNCSGYTMTQVSTGAQVYCQ